MESNSDTITSSKRITSLISNVAWVSHTERLIIYFGFSVRLSYMILNFLLKVILLSQLPFMRDIHKIKIDFHLFILVEFHYRISI